MKSVATIFKLCTCGAEVALVLSQAGKLYPVDIGDQGIVTTKGVKSASIDTTDFHHCAWYPGLADFIQQAIQRGALRLRMRLLTTKDRVVLLSWQDRWQNLVFVSDGRPREISTSYGRVGLDGGGFRAGDDEVPKDVLDLLNAVNDNPAKAAAAYGRATSQCCFCERPLDDERSIEAGYGKTCARRFGLPWGDNGENTRKRAKRTRKAVYRG